MEDGSERSCLFCWLVVLLSYISGTFSRLNEMVAATFHCCGTENHKISVIDGRSFLVEWKDGSM